MSGKRRVRFFEQQVTWYTGICPRCQRQWSAFLSVFKNNNLGIVPPPAINIMCPCYLPVTEVALMHQP